MTEFEVDSKTNVKTEDNSLVENSNLDPTEADSKLSEFNLAESIEFSLDELFDPTEIKNPEYLVQKEWVLFPLNKANLKNALYHSLNVLKNPSMVSRYNLKDLDEIFVDFETYPGKIITTVKTLESLLKILSPAFFGLKGSLKPEYLTKIDLTKFLIYKYKVNKLLFRKGSSVRLVLDNRTYTIESIDRVKKCAVIRELKKDSSRTNALVLEVNLKYLKPVVL